ncbi:checkpoint protein HUS1-like isoform X2 [Amphibalanus amphitrite]|uniref:checkpoint protein HUS1-like isoform X2 n=2 Tax=Amphibalanus amphitrite TaxID=1232801 RepID=UPI001C91878C|nr:checkpoint protein HUS1-like isoform X2 [Amphibalanus amphitrite]
MKFRGKICEQACIKQFTSIISTLAKLAKMCTLRITSSHLYFVVMEATLSSTPGLWCELQQGHFFNEFNMEGVSPEHNEIYLELKPDNLARTLSILKSSAAVRSLKIKLTKKHSACLTFEIESPSQTSLSRLCTHDIPVTVLPRRLWAGLAEPRLPQFSVSLDLPALRLLRPVVERMRAIGPRLTVSASRSGRFVLRVESDQAVVATHFGQLRTHPAGDEPTDDDDVDSEHMFDVQVEIKPFSMFLAGDQFHPARAVCNLVEDRMLHLFLIHDDITLQYFIPACSS